MWNVKECDDNLMTMDGHKGNELKFLEWFPKTASDYERGKGRNELSLFGEFVLAIILNFSLIGKGKRRRGALLSVTNPIE